MGRRTKPLYRYQAAVRAYLSVRPYDDAAERMVTSIVLGAAETMSDPADLINRAVEVLQAAAVDLWTDRLEWLGGLIDPDPLLDGTAHTKLRQSAAEAADWR